MVNLAVKRIIAHLIDRFLLAIIFFSLFPPMVVITLTRDLPILALLLVIVGVLCLTIAFLIKDGLSNGRSPGKIAMGLQTVNESGSPCSFSQSAIRNIVFIIPLVQFIELIIMFVDPDQRRLGDKFAGTRVIAYDPSIKAEARAKKRS